MRVSSSWLYLIATALSIASLACGSEPLVFRDWTVSVPEGTPTHEYRFVPEAERTETLKFERDLVISEGMGRGLYNPSALAVAADGTIYVLDSGNFRIVAFDQQGIALREFGSQGQGPGELLSPVGFGVAGDRVIVTDIRNNRLSTFDTDGELVADTQWDDRFWIRTITARDDDLLAIVFPPMPLGARDEPVVVPWLLARYSTTGEQLAILAEREVSAKAFFHTESILGHLPMVFPNPIGVIRHDAATYVTNSDEYQILALGPDGTLGWALRTTFATTSPTEDQKHQMLGRFRELTELEPEVAGARIIWPQSFAALENIETDANGNLYAFPYSYRPPDIEPGPDHLVPIDIYSPEGLSLSTAMSPINSWDAAYGDHIFRIEDDHTTGERVVARYRIASFE